MAENNESPQEGIISRIKEYVVSGWKKISEIVGSINSAVNKILDSWEGDLSGKKNETSSPSSTTSTPAPVATEEPAPSSDSTTTETPQDEEAEQTAAQTEEPPETNEAEPTKPQINLINGNIDNTTKQKLRPIITAIGNSPTKEQVKDAITTILQNTINEGQKTVTIPPIGISNHGLSAEEVAKAIKETLEESHSLTEQITQINILIGNAPTKIAFDQVFADTQSQSSPTQMAA